MMNFNCKTDLVLKIITVLSACFVLIPNPAFGVAFDNSTVGNRSTLAGNGFSGLADDATAVYYNPAGMISPHRQTEWDMELGASFTATRFYYTDGTAYSTSNDKFVIPGLFITKTINERWAVGFGAYTPFAGGGATYENYLNSGHERSAAVGYTAFTPSIAYKINDQWAVGLGISGYYGVNKSKAFSYGHSIETDYCGLAGVGAHASVMYRPNLPWSIGLTARTPVHTRLDGEFKIDGMESKARLEADFPYSFDLGVGYRKDRLKAGLSFIWMGYSTMDEIKQTSGLIGEQRSKTGFRNGFRLSAGSEYQLRERLYAIVGVRYVSSMQRDEFNQALSNEVRCLAFSGGLRVGVTRNTDLTIGIMHTEGIEHSVDHQKFDADYNTIIAAVRAQF